VVARRWMPRSAPFMPAAAAAATLIGFAVEARAVMPLVKRAEVSGLPAILGPLAEVARDYPDEKGLRPRIYRGQDFPTVDPTLPAAENARVMHACAGENSALPYGFAHVPGYQPARTTSARIEKFFEKVPVIVDLFDVRYLVMPEKDLPTGPKRVVALMPPMALVETRRMRPRAFVAPRWSWRPTDDAALEGLYPEGFRDVGAIRLVGSGPAAGPERGEVVATRCGVEVSRPEEILLRCASPMGGYAVLLEEWTAGWSATVNGHPATIERVDALFRAVAVGGGPHEVRFRYATPGLTAGAVASLLAWALLAGLFWLTGSARAAKAQAAAERGGGDGKDRPRIGGGPVSTGKRAKM
jgi:Bacterial membrane protein YfhO